MKRFGGPGYILSKQYLYKGIKKQACKNRPKCQNEITEEGEEAPEVEEDQAPAKQKKQLVKF